MENPFDDPQFLQRTLNEYARGFAALAGATWAPAGPWPPDPAAYGQAFAAGYQRLFSPAGLASLGPGTGNGAAFEQYRRAAARSAAIAASIAQDAGRRLAEALAASGPGAPPVTTLRDLQALWIECGEAAYAEAARRDEFAAAQAELLMALVELRAVST